MAALYPGGGFLAELVKGYMEISLLLGSDGECQLGEIEDFIVIPVVTLHEQPIGDGVLGSGFKIEERSVGLVVSFSRGIMVGDHVIVAGVRSKSGSGGCSPGHGACRSPSFGQVALSGVMCRI